jgi:FkbM family methyltransferase
MKIFLDVGAHVGQTMRAVLDPKFGFDQIHCFEPAEACLKHLKAVRDSRVSIHPFGLWRETCEKPLYDPGQIGASIFEDKPNLGAIEVAHFVRASDWLRENVSDGTEVFLKLNCEGSECDILDDLIQSGEIAKIKHALIHFDVRKVPSQAHREGEVRSQLDALGVSYVEASEVLIGPSHASKIQRWLDDAGAAERRLPVRRRLRSWFVRLRHRWIPLISQRLHVGWLARRLLPRALYTRAKILLYPEQRR